MPAAKREAVREMKELKSLSERRACRLIRISRSTYRYKAVPEKDGPIRRRLKELAGHRLYLRYGTPRLTELLREEGYLVNHKRIERIYREEGLSYRRKKTKKRQWGHSRPLCKLTGCNEEWAMDFISDSTTSGRNYRILNVLDQYSRESLAMEIDTSLPAERVVRVLNRICEERGHPKRIRMDNGSEFTSKIMQHWFSDTRVAPVFIEPGKPNQNGYVESFHGKLRDECLGLYEFKNLREVREACYDWRAHYNNTRKHSALGKLPPAVFAARHAKASPPTAPSPQHDVMGFGIEL